MTWPVEHDTFLRENAATMTLQQIADAIGRRKEAVRSYAGNRGIRCLNGSGGGAGGWTAQQITTLTGMWAEGHSAGEIAGALGKGFTRNAVIGKVHRLGLKRSLDTAKAIQIAQAQRVRIRAAQQEGLDRRKAERLLARIAKGLPTRATREARAKALKPEPKPMLAKPVLLTGQEKVWTERGPFECNWIVAGEGADSLACCAKVHARGWCAFHYAQGTTKPEKPAPKHRRPIEPTFYDVEAA